jgi:hypothetical protein
LVCGLQVLFKKITKADTGRSFLGLFGRSNIDVTSGTTPLPVIEQPCHKQADPA